MDKKEIIGFHKGALDCLVKERAELARLLSIVDSLIQLHSKELEKEGVKLNVKTKKEELDEGFIDPTTMEE